ncbi:MAG TPA: methyltransferase [Lapillicoccus sp.]|nr:methyltransferase [Lapillicoccus sp.]
MTTLVEPVAPADKAAGALAERLFGGVLATMELFTVHLGVRFGFYDALRSPLTSAELAASTGVHPRYVREWCEQQSAAGILAVDDPGAPPEDRRFVLPAGYAAALLDEDHPAYVGSLAVLAGGIGASVVPVVDAYRRGTGLSFGGYGDEIRTGQGLLNRAGFLGRLGQAWVPALPGIADRLGRPGAVALDVGCGVGWSTIALARAFPGLTVVGLDSDEASIVDARRNAASSEVDHRVRFEVVASDAGVPPGSADVVFFLEALHDMAHPVAALATARTALRPGGRVVVVDENVLDVFTPNAPETERLLYASSVLHCLPVGLSEPDSAGTGAMMRPDVLRGYANAAGFASVDEVDATEGAFRSWILAP